ncbi:MAG: hypothetical protein A3F91_02940 [Flavobacteria bacterium RIFCSPLOWO2_12_FULL_35_11]|nr:MAG: hypothetical protein A3F91_02940 [Flavobacteria bacterium RIFCSPLOWO2_12_FULL_35_11]
MKKIVFFTIIFLLIKSYSSYSQIILKNDDITAYKNIPQEKIFVHHNTTFLLTGEYLYYKVYCMNANTNNLSDLSKIAYVELVGTDKISVFKHKLKLNNGLGQGDFLIPIKIPSGNYKLVAYTQWMKNSEHNQFFQSDISIINPFQENQSSILEKNQPVTIQNLNHNIENTTNNNILSDSEGNDYLDINLNENSFKNREKVVLTIKSLKNNISYGNYSISVRKIDTLQISKRPTANNFMSLYPQISSNSKSNTSIYLPELRGELITGKLFYKDAKLAASNKKVALSIQGKQSIFKIATTNDLGVFYFNVQEEYDNPYAIIQVVNNEKNNFNIRVDGHSSINYENLDFYSFKITPETKDYILKRSVYNQIDNVYSIIKPNIIKSIDSVSPFYNSTAKVYYLDDYTRFPTIKETVVEIIKEVFIKQKKEKSTFHVRLYDQLSKSDLSTLVLVDGILIQNHNELLNLNARNVEKISVLSDEYMFDSMVFDGIISIQTFIGDYQADPLGIYIEKLPLFTPLVIKNYYNQIYDNSKKSDRIPDYRSQLLWVPNFNLNKNEDSLFFYTSDNNGDYEISLEGFTKDGMPISLRKMISVK